MGPPRREHVWGVLQDRGGGHRHFCGDDIASAEEYCAYMGEPVGKIPRIVYREEGTHTSLVPDTTLMHEVLGTCEVGWQEMCEKLVGLRVWETGYTRAY